MTLIKAVSGIVDERVSSWNSREQGDATGAEVLVRKHAKVDVGRGGEQE